MSSQLEDLNGNLCMPHIAVERALQNTGDRERILSWLYDNRNVCLQYKTHIQIVSHVFKNIRIDLWAEFLENA